MRQVSECMRLFRAFPRRSLVSSYSSFIRFHPIISSSVRFFHVERDKNNVSEPVVALKPSLISTSEVKIEPISTLLDCINDPKSRYHVARKAFNNLRSRNLKLSENLYLSLLYKASREGRFVRVWEGYNEFLEDEKTGLVKTIKRASTTWPSITTARMQMHRFVLWSMLDTDRAYEMGTFYQNEVIGKCNVAGIHEPDSYNFLLRVECTTKVMDETDQGLRQRVETLLDAMERLKLHTSYSSTHMLVRLILYRPEIFFDALTNEESVGDELRANLDTKYTAKAMGELVIEYMDRFPYALALDSKRLSIAVSAAAAAGQYDAAKTLLQHGAAHHVPIDAGSFAHAVGSASDDAGRFEIADLYMHAKEHERIDTVQDTDSSCVNYLLLYAILDGNFKHMMELLQEMQLNNNKASHRTVSELFKSIAHFRAEIQRVSTRNDADKKLAECPTIMELFEKFSNAIPYTTHSLSQGILLSLYAGDLAVALELMRTAFWCEDIKLRPEIYSQLLYPLLAGGQRGGDKSSDASVFDRLEVERHFDRLYPNQRAHLNALIVNICQSNEDFSTMLVCLDRWQAQGHPPMSRRVVQRVFDMISKQVQQLRKRNDNSPLGTTFIVDGTKLSYEAFLVRYRNIITWDAWTFERAIVRARTSGLYADVVVLLAQAASRGLILNTAAYVVSLCVLEEIGEPSAIVACVEKMKANDAWEKAVAKDLNVQGILDRALDNLPVEEAKDREQ
ncbi:hypothetical protein KXD40_000755 [Peronospora effusa]|uniref:Uncharacterized protein n=2 Tax=Peronospora effusa TaxID=542832 RepID=A0A3M6VVZ3_9STRA|nr:hypothetical protein DD238_001049 [Peronospora effusa]UIZ21150.1 hypothetical protein KXD40_000755 [Peronospora effusa]CAI5705809.1 unnamed protein product [Peronospora effusa]